MPVAALLLDTGDWRTFAPGGGEVTRRVAKAYKDYVAHYVKEHASFRLL